MAQAGRNCRRWSYGTDPPDPPGEGTRTGGSGRLHTFLKYLFPEKLKPRLTAQKRALNVLASDLPSPHCCLACVLNWEHTTEFGTQSFSLDTLS